MIYLSGVSGDGYPIAHRLPPSAGRFHGWDWGRYFGIIRALAENPSSRETYDRAVYAFQRLPPVMVFSDAISTAAWARFQQMFQTRGRDVALKYMLRLPRMTNRFNPADQRNWYEVEKEWQASEAQQQGLGAITARPLVTTRMPTAPTARPPPPRGYREPPPPPPIAPPVMRVAPIPLPAPPPPRYAAPQGLAVPPEITAKQIDRIIAEHVSRGTQSQIEASLTPEQIAYMDRRQPGWREHLRRQFPEPETPLEAAKERSWNYEFELPGRKAIITDRMDNVLRWSGQTKFRFPPIALPTRAWESIVRQVYNHVEPRINRQEVGIALRLRGYYPPGEGVLTMPEQARRLRAARPPGFYDPEEHEIGSIFYGINRMLKDWQGKLYPNVAPPRTVLPSFGAAARSAHGLASMFNRDRYRGRHRFTRGDIEKALRARGYISALELRPPAAPAVRIIQPPAAPPLPTPYDPNKQELPPVRMGIQKLLKKWRGIKYRNLAARPTALPYFADAARKAFSYAHDYNNRYYRRRFRFTRSDVEKALKGRGYMQQVTLPGPDRISIQPPVAPPRISIQPPVAPPRISIQPPVAPPLKRVPPAITYDRYTEEVPPVRWAVDRELKMRGGLYPTVAATPTWLPRFDVAVGNAVSAARKRNTYRYYREKYQFTRSDVETAFKRRGYMPHAPATPGQQTRIAPPPPPAVAGMSTGYYVSAI